MDVQWINLDRISVDGTQTRAELREQAVVEYAELIESGVVMEPAILFDDGKKLHLAAGFHRRAAYERAGRTRMPCLIRRGGQWNAIAFGIKDNLKHRGERVTNRDKAHNIQMVLRMKPGFSNSVIADPCGTTDKTVTKYRKSLETTSEIPRSNRRTGRDGRTINSAAAGDRSERGDSDTTKASDANHYSFGGEWASDGEGSRYCQKCMVSHPEKRQPYPGPGRRREAGLGERA